MKAITRKIIAVLLNPTIDMLYEIKNFEAGQTYLVRDPIIYPVGKAISFSLALKNIDRTFKNVKILGFVGKNDKKLYSHFLRAHNIDFKLISIKGKTRSNKTIIDPALHRTTHIRELGFELKEEDLNKLIDLIEKECKREDIILFSGSIPQGVNSKIYFEIMSSLKKKKVMTVLDSSREALVHGVQASPTLIKPNLTELNQILNFNPPITLDSLKTLEDVMNLAECAKILLKKGIRYILITLGEKGAVCLTNNLILYGYIKTSDILDTVGCGDSFLGGFCYNYFQEKSILECFRLALACGAANALTSGPGMFRKKNVDSLLFKTKIHRLD
ncbi:MAG: 1-phosphofructokinase family hexose kinase [Promethearchaeota archaeon]